MLAQSSLSNIAKDLPAPFDVLFKEYIYVNPNILCDCKTNMEHLCVSNCKQTSLHCGNKNCNVTHLNHKFCKTIKLDGLTQLLSMQIEPHQTFLTKIFEIEEKFIAELRQRRQNLAGSLRYGGFQDEERVAIEEIYVKKNAKFSKGLLIHQLYDKLMKKKDEKIIIQEQIKLYQKQTERVSQELNKHLAVTIKNYTLSSKGFSEIFSSTFLSSKMMKFQQQIDFIMKTLQKPKGFQLLFRASQHQFSAAKFYEHCDRVNNVMVLAKTQFGKVFGGYNPYGWSSEMHGKYNTDQQKKCFIFSVDLKQKMDITNINSSVYNNKSYGPTFGGGYDFYLSDSCNNNKSSYSNFPHGYNFTAKPYTNNQQSWTAFCGATNGKNFSVVQYEVFKVVK